MQLIDPITSLIILSNKYRPISPFLIRYAAYAALVTVMVWVTLGPCWIEGWWREQAISTNVDFDQESRLQRDMKILIRRRLSKRADIRPKPMPTSNQLNRIRGNISVKRELLVT